MIEPLETESNYIFWFKVSSKLFNLSDDLIFGIVYIPPEGSSYLSPDAFDQVENEYRVLSQNYKYICSLGDFNSGTADDPDFIEIFINEHELDFTQFVENDLAILDTLKIDRKRKSMDDGKNRSGNILLELCRGNNLFIVNGRIGDDYLESGRLTCRNSSVVDYYICSPCFFEYFCNFKVVDSLLPNTASNDIQQHVNSVNSGDVDIRNLTVTLIRTVVLQRSWYQMPGCSVQCKINKNTHGYMTVWYTKGIYVSL